MSGLSLWASRKALAKKVSLTKFSVSDSSNYKLCPRQFYYRKVLGWEPAERPKHLDLGIAYDKLLEILDTKGPDVATSSIASLFSDEHDAAEAEVILAYYLGTVYREDPLVPCEGGNQHGFGIDTGACRITGYIDKLHKRNISGVDEYVVVERKTTTEPIEQNSLYWNRLDLDPQIRSYVWYLRKRGWKAGWVCYEVIRKLNSAIDRKLVKKKEIPIDQYRSLLHGINYSKKTLVARKWIYISEEMTNEFEVEQESVFTSYQSTMDRSQVAKEVGFDPEMLWVKHERSCDAYGGCEYAPICKRQVTFESSGAFVQGEKRFK